MPKIGDGLDAVTAFAGAAAAGMSLFLPFSFGADSTIESPYRVTSLINSVPRAAALGLIVAVVVAVLARPITRPGLVWLAATAGAVASAINYLIGQTMTSADVLTTQNYIDSLCGGVLFGALGICAWRMRWSAVGFALGVVVVFVYGEIVAVFTSNAPATADKAVHTPFWLVGAAVLLLAVNTVRHRHGIMLPAVPRLAADLPISPIIAATVLSLSLLLATEWLGREFDGRRGNSWQIALAVVVTVVAAFAAALLLPDRDGTGVLVAVSVAAAADSLADAPSLGWNLLLVLVLGAAAVLAGLRWGTPWVALLGAAALCAFAMVADRFPWAFAWPLGVLLLSVVSGFAAGSTRVGYLPSAVLGLGALFLPTILWAIPTERRHWPTGSTSVDADTPGWVALSLTVGAAGALTLLYRIRSGTPKPVTEQ
ncbi:hypothetical protein FEK33_04100 [Nocardia asteroides NBRC 15531]|uniref:Uncharacterized protein n=1 Tax=Nocardia asteroides NBRC 15531 TaxID=1110697 RepID=U5E849_NOCAS|nr:hypothetical protein [Nocardia asteroides]TLF69482.1 hypothetical protein FEK33_04100 [Nocardia asteroides NBRC 15531]UGT48984.1 hypothetical protein LT345_31955 [Nocardia asteroides]SFL76723.1 hypothetical protein SAMN05444423_101834 [Nocardia asteroides]VEG31244.1 Uncharacterised protein [Nocardia asteroides]GAD83535.1 hypothetical protein NCAST_20_01020 [Nocardia asteroides NBRC 15531]